MDEPQSSGGSFAGQRLYHEKQVAALCGVHCLNTLLQGPYFTEVELSQIAHQLDALERQFMQEGGVDSAEYQKFISEESGNVAADGMFSIQVLCKALEVWNLQVIPLDNPEVRETARQAPQEEEAFVCNLQEHWLSIRKVEGNWWNFNSLFPAPQPLSQFYLAAFLDSLKAQGYTIFVVRGSVPPPNPSRMDGPGRWYTPAEAQELNADADKARQKGRLANALETALNRLTAQGPTVTLRPRGQGSSSVQQQPAGDDVGMLGDDDAHEEERQLNEAIAASLAMAGGQAPFHPTPEGPMATGGNAAVDEQRALNEAIAASLAMAGGQQQPFQPTPEGPMATGGGPAGVPMDMQGGDFDDEDPELAAAIAASLSDVQGGSSAPAPAEPEEELPVPGPAPDEGAEGSIELAIRLPDGRRVMRRFSGADTTVAMLYGYLKQEGVDVRQRQLTNAFPRKVFPSSSTCLSEAGLENRSMLSLEPVSK